MNKKLADVTYLKVIWTQLDRYKDAVISKQSLAELIAFKNTLLEELTKKPGYNEPGAISYFDTQCKNIEARYSDIGSPANN